MGARRWSLAGVALLLVLLLPHGGLPGNADARYHLTAYFTRAVGFFPDSKVKVMGIDVGTISAVEIDGERVRVEFTVDRAVTLPADVQATIEAVTLIGERNLVLSPPWTEAMAAEGRATLEDGAVIPVERTHIPVEVDDALQAMTDLAKALDPAAVSQLISSSAAALSGHGATLNGTLEQSAMLTTTLASVDDQLMAVVANVHQIAGTLETRQAQLGRVIDSFAQVSGALADERGQIVALLDGVARLPQEGLHLLADYGGQLPSDIASLVHVADTIAQNAGSLEQLLSVTPDLVQTLLDTWRPDLHMLEVKFSATPSVATLLDNLLGPLGLGSLLCAVSPSLCVPQS